jgi:hypothetical protein
MTDGSDLRAFSRLVRALDPWLDRLVIIGGWAHRLSRLHPHAQALDYAPLATLDADIALPAGLLTTTPSIRDRLRAYGFTEEFLGDDRPPATHYALRDEASGFYAEFVTPLTGGAYDRRSKRKATIQIAGVTSQQLRHIDVLLIDPWVVDFEFTGGAEERKTLQIANPACFLAQKILIHSKRNREDRARDVLYVHDTLEVFGGRLDQLRAEWQTRVAPRLHRNHAQAVRKAPDRLFGEITDAIRNASIAAAGRDLTPESVRETCRFGLQHLFT